MWATPPSINPALISTFPPPKKFPLNSQLRNLNLHNNLVSVVEQNTNKSRANFELYSQLRNLDLVVAVKSGSGAEQKQQNTKKSRAKYRQQGAKGEVVEEKRGDSEELEKKLSGFDVLRALEKATAQKMKKKRNGSDNSLLSRKVTGQGRKGRQEDEDLADFGNKNVRALSIKEDWGNRLDELEKRLQELVDTSVV